MGKLIDMVGQKYGKLTVVKRAPENSKDNKAQWICNCDCGNTDIIVLGKSLRNGHTKSCGCYRKDLGRQTRKDSMGDRYGRLTLVEPLNNGYWQCKCDCGNDTVVLGTNLRTGNTTSCGCYFKEVIKRRREHPDLSGNVYGKLTVIYEVFDPEDRHHTKWYCKCECGNSSIVDYSSLIDGSTKSCGCMRTKSYGEDAIIELLNKNNISFQRECSFESLTQFCNKKLRFDFYVNNNYLIEFDGIQHFDNHKHWRENNFNQIQENDNYKNQWCKDNNITLIRIPYTQLHNLTIEDLLPETSQFIFVKGQ